MNPETGGFPQATAPGSATQAPKLLDRYQQALARDGFLPRQAEQYSAWCLQFIRFHGRRHPQEMGAAEVRQYLDQVTGTQGLADSRQAEEALRRLYRDVLGRELDLPRPKRLLEQVHEALRVRHYSLRTEECYVQWARRYILFHNKRHPAEMGGREIAEFLTHLAVSGTVSASTQTQALNALVFLHKQVLGLEVGALEAVRAKRSLRLPVVLSRVEVRLVLEALEGCHGLYPILGRLLYGTGMRLLEGCGLRVKDLDLERSQIMVRQGKGDKDRVVMLPKALRAELARQLESRRELHGRDLARGLVWVTLPDALARKYPNAMKELGWQYLFASERQSQDPRTGNWGRYHVHGSALQRAVKEAVGKVGLVKRVSCHTFRHSFATHSSAAPI